MLLQIAEATQVTQQVTKELLEKGATTNPTADPSGSLLVMCLIVAGVFFMALSGALIYLVVSGKKSDAAPATPLQDAYDIDLIKTLAKIETTVQNIYNTIINDRVRH